MVIMKSCQWLDSNHGPLVLEVTYLPTEPQPVPIGFISSSIPIERERLTS